ncbi:Aldo_ket_red domain-containing protein [Psidium guajava]|nr:Aldo_ket_red domain-containing protein [Psidium guajava]
MSSAFSGDETAPFFGFLGAAAALVFSYPNHNAVARSVTLVSCLHVYVVSCAHRWPRKLMARIK